MSSANPLHPPVPDQKQTTIIWENLLGASTGLALSALISEQKKPIVIITPNTITAMRLEFELQFFQTNPFPIIHFADWETLPYDHFSPHQDIISSRLAALNQIPQLKTGAIITPITTLMHQIAPRDYLEGNIFLLRTGDSFNIDQTRKKLEKAGYYCVSKVQEHGEFAVRGSIVDLFPMGSDLPYRIDLFDDEVDSIRTFSPETQRSLEKVDEIELLPAKEFPLSEEAIERFRQNFRAEFSGNPLNSPLYQDLSEGITTPGIEYYLPYFFEKTSSLFDYFPENSLIVCAHDIHTKAEEFWQEIRSRYDQRGHDITRPILSPQQMFISPSEIFNKINQTSKIKISKHLENEHNAFQFSTFPSVDLNVDHKAQRPLQHLENFIKEFSGRILFCAETTGRREVLLQLFSSIQLYPKSFISWKEFLDSETPFGIIIAPLEEGLQLEEPRLALIAESQIFGKRVVQRRRRKESTQDTDAIIKDLTELHVGDPIVHIDHGVGRYLGLQALTVGEQLSEFLHIEYADDAKLYVPVSSLHLISRYSGVDPEHAPIHRLGTQQWQKAKRKASEQVRDVAAELLNIYAHRQMQKGATFTTPNGDLHTFAAAFPFEETPDQQKAIEQVIQDMLGDKPMDRLICGDVGFGKTEVAMRAAFLAVQNEKQVCLLVPTTLLAEQHYQNFQDRFADWPIKIEVISRFKTSKEQQKVIKGLEEGKVDIVIGTHKLLQQDIKFKNLGLLIIDEEHRFGVRQKEYLKSLRTNVHILTLTATPIPRTLNMAFAGIRDLSIIATPPARRLAINTFLHEYDPHIIQEAITREIMRGGQAYFLHNDVATIERTARDLEKLIPEARIGIAHGQMRERELEQVMSDFYHRRFNVLVATTIIESGIDIPSANTIIIDRADKFGIAQLHQLRGRVGRSHHQAYAYLLIPSFKNLTPDAEKRLNAISAYEDLGIGFTLATHDLEIRGAGELLGEGQSGNMQAVGFTLYMDLLARAVDALKSGNDATVDFITPRSTEIDLQIPTLIPDSYLGDVQLRLQFYKRIASAKSSAELDELQVEMIDRFGLLPQPSKNLFYLNELRLKAEQLGIIKIEANNKGGKIEFNEKPNIDPLKIIQLIQKQSQAFKLEGSTHLRFFLKPHENHERLKLVENILLSLY